LTIAFHVFAASGESPFFGIAGKSPSVSTRSWCSTGAVRRMVLSLAVAAPLRRTDIDPAFARRQWLHTVSCAALAGASSKRFRGVELAFSRGYAPLGTCCL